MADHNFTIPGEVWKQIIGFPGYEISDHGRVRSFWKWSSNGNGRNIFPTLHCSPVRILKPVKYNKSTLGIRLCYNGIRKHRMIHQLVLESFVGPKPFSNWHACHNDGNNQNNKLNNLRWDSPQNNEFDKRLHGTLSHGESHPLSKLTYKDVSEIRFLHKKGFSLNYMAKIYKVTYQCIWLIVHNINWKS